MFHVKHVGPVYHFLALWLTLPIFLIFVLGCIQLAPDPPMAHARPQPSAAAAASARECYDMQRSPAVNALKIFEFTVSKRMPYESMAYKTMETDSKSGSDYGLPFDHCQFLNDNALSKRRYIHREKAYPLSIIGNTGFPQIIHNQNRCCKSTTTCQIDNKISTGFPSGLDNCG